MIIVIVMFSMVASSFFFNLLVSQLLADPLNLELRECQMRSIKNQFVVPIKNHTHPDRIEISLIWQLISSWVEICTKQHEVSHISNRPLLCIACRLFFVFFGTGSAVFIPPSLLTLKGMQGWLEEKSSLKLSRQWNLGSKTDAMGIFFHLSPDLDIFFHFLSGFLVV